MPGLAVPGLQGKVFGGQHLERPGLVVIIRLVVLDGQHQAVSCISLGRNLRPFYGQDFVP